MNLTVKNLHKGDFAPYTCSSENALGKSDARIRLQGKGNCCGKVFNELCNDKVRIKRRNEALK